VPGQLPDELRRAPAPSTCTVGKSASLAGAGCQVWKDIFHDLDAFSWTDCASFYSDPCSCKFVTCGFVEHSSDPNSHILALNLSGAGAHGDLPRSISQLKHLGSLDLESAAALSGARPSARAGASIPALDMHYQQLPGSTGVPRALLFLDGLTTLNLYSNALSGSPSSRIWP
jgi:hypothetical protein